MRFGNSSMRRAPVPAGNRKFPIGVQHVAPPVWFGYTPQVPTGDVNPLGRLARSTNFKFSGNQRGGISARSSFNGILDHRGCGGNDGFAAARPGATGGSGAKRATTMEGPRRVRPF